MNNTSDQTRKVGDVAQRNGLGRPLSTTRLASGSNYASAVVLSAVAVGGVALLVAMGVPSALGHIALVILIAPFSVLCGGAAVVGVRDGIAARGHYVHTYEFGLVVDTKADPLPLPYADLLIYRERINHTLKGWGIVERIDVNWRVRRRDGTAWDMLTVSTKPIDDLLETALVKACEAQAAPQAAALSAGSTLTYGGISFDGHRLLRPLGLDWSYVRAVYVDNGAVFVKVSGEDHSGKERPLRVNTVGNIPNFPLFWDLFQRAFANSRPGSSAGAWPSPPGPRPAGPPTSATGGLGEPGGPGSPTDRSSGSGSSGSRS